MLRARRLLSRPLRTRALHARWPPAPAPSPSGLLLVAARRPRTTAAVVGACGGGSAMFARLLLAPHADVQCDSTAGKQPPQELVRSVASIAADEGRIRTYAKVLWHLKE